MNLKQRTRKFNEFVRISQEGISEPTKIAKKLGISISTLYNWRNRLLNDNQQALKDDKPSSEPMTSFSKIAVEPTGNSIIASSFIEIIIANDVLLRAPVELLENILHTILNYKVNRGQM